MYNRFQLKFHVTKREINVLYRPPKGLAEPLEKFLNDKTNHFHISSKNKCFILPATSILMY